MNQPYDLKKPQNILDDYSSKVVQIIERSDISLDTILSGLAELSKLDIEEQAVETVSKKDPNNAQIALLIQQFEHIDRSCIHLLEQMEAAPNPSQIADIKGLAEELEASLDVMSADLAEQSASDNIDDAFASQFVDYKKVLNQLFEFVERLEIEQNALDSDEIEQLRDEINQHDPSNFKAPKKQSTQLTVNEAVKEDVLNKLDQVVKVIEDEASSAALKQLLSELQLELTQFDDPELIEAFEQDISNVADQQIAVSEESKEALLATLKEVIWDLDTGAIKDDIHEKIASIHTFVQLCFGENAKENISEVHSALNELSQSLEAKYPDIEPEPIIEEKPVSEPTSNLSSSSITPEEIPSTTSNDDVMDQHILSSIEEIESQLNFIQSNLKEAVTRKEVDDLIGSNNGSSVDVDKLKNKLSDLEYRLDNLKHALDNKVDENYFRERIDELQDSLSHNGGGEDASEIKNLRRQLENLERLAKENGGSVADAYASQQLEQLKSEIAITDKQTRLLLTDLNQKVEGALLKSDFTRRLSDYARKEHIRSLEEGVDDKVQRQNNHIKQVEEQVNKRLTEEQGRNLAKEVFNEQRAEENWVEKDEFYNSIGRIDHLNSRLAEKADLESIDEKLMNYLSKEDFNEKERLLELHKNETRLLLSEMSERVYNLPQHHEIDERFVSRQEFIELREVRKKVIGEIRLDIDVINEKLANCASVDDLHDTIQQLQDEVNNNSVFAEYETSLNELKTKVKDLASQDLVEGFKLELHKRITEQEEKLSAAIKDFENGPELDEVEKLIQDSLDAQAASKDEVERQKDQINAYENELDAIKNKNDELSTALDNIRSEMQNLDFNKEEFIQQFNDEMKASLFKMISDYDASLQHDMEKRVEEWKEFHEELKQEQVDKVQAHLDEELEKASASIMGRLEQEAEERTKALEAESEQAKEDLKELKNQHEELLGKIESSRKEVEELEKLKNDYVKSFSDELRQTREEIFANSEASLKKYYDEQLAKLKHNYDEKNEQILDLLAESKGDWFSQNMMGIIAVVLAAVGIVLGLTNMF